MAPACAALLLLTLRPPFCILTVEVSALNFSVPLQYNFVDESAAA